MTPSPQIAAAFEQWRLAELAGHFTAKGMPDDVGTWLGERTTIAVETLASIPAANATDVLLKLLPLALILNDPPADAGPLCPVSSPVDGTSYHEDALWRGIIADLPRLSPLVAAAMAETGREAEQ